MKFINIQTEKFKMIDKLSDKEKVELLNLIIEYARNEIEKSEASPIVCVMFNPIQNDMDYYNASYKAKVARARANGKAGGRPPKEKKGLIIEGLVYVADNEE